VGPKAGIKCGGKVECPLYSVPFIPPKSALGETETVFVYNDVKQLTSEIGDCPWLPSLVSENQHTVPKAATLRYCSHEDRS
jgi:hypothetical protein